MNDGTGQMLAPSSHAGAASDPLVPFMGAIQGTASFGGSDGSLLIFNENGGGVATQLGRFTATLIVKVDPATCIGKGTSRFVGANGDALDASFTGSCEPTATPGVFRVTEIYTINGGTGRFINAQGSFTMERLIDENTGLTSGSFHGSITAP